MRTWWAGHPRWALLSACLLVAAGCSHGEPFSPADTSSDTPLAPDIVPLRLTWGGARDPAWLGNDTILYSFASAEHPNGGLGPPDLCIGILPATGGRRVRAICSRSAFEADTLDVQVEPAPEPGTDRIAFMRGRLSRGVGAGLTRFIVGPLATAPEGTELQSALFTQPVAQIVESGMLRWVAPDTLLFMGADNAVYTPCDTCNPVVLRRWRVAFRLAAEAGATAQVVAGSDYATSVAPASTSGHAFMTMTGDTRLLDLDLTTGAVHQVLSWTGGDVPRDVDYAAGRVALISGGQYTLITDDDGNPAQGNDTGGDINVIDLATSSVTRLTATGLWFRHPRLSPDGRSVVAVGLARGTMQIPGPGSAPSYPAGDLYRFDLP
jgi:hypothetical protein